MWLDVGEVVPHSYILLSMHHYREQSVLIISLQLTILFKIRSHLLSLPFSRLTYDLVHVQKFTELKSCVHLLACSDEEVKSFQSQEKHRRQWPDFLPFPGILKAMLFWVVFVIPTQLFRSHKFDQRFSYVLRIEDLKLEHRKDFSADRWGFHLILNALDQRRGVSVE